MYFSLNQFKEISDNDKESLEKTYYVSSDDMKIIKRYYSFSEAVIISMSSFAETAIISMSNIAVNRQCGGFSLVDDVFVNINNKLKELGYSKSEILDLKRSNNSQQPMLFRSHQIVVEEIEKFGLSESADMCCTLKILSVPTELLKHVYITERDGYEDIQLDINSMLKSLVSDECEYLCNGQELDGCQRVNERAISMNFLNIIFNILSNPYKYAYDSTHSVYECDDEYNDDEW